MNNIINDTLTNKEINNYDILKTTNNVLEYLKKYKLLKYKCFDMPQLKISKDFKLIYVNDTNYLKDSYNNIDKYIDNKDEYLNINEKLFNISKILNEKELIYFSLCLINSTPEYKCYKEIGCSNRGIIRIKNSCIIKIALCLNLEVYK